MMINQKTLKDIPDLYEIVYDLTQQVPEGMVTTYGSIANALGDIRASRAVGEIEHENTRPVLVPCHRVVYADGGLSGFGAPGGAETKKKLLYREGVRVTDGKIQNFKKRLFTDFELPGTKPLVRLRKIQDRLCSKVEVKNGFGTVETICGLDVAYSGRDAFGAAVVMDIKSKTTISEHSVECRVNFPYIPTYLAFRELPVILKLLAILKNEPDVIMLDGNGILHPRRFGVASHVGVALDWPTIGAAKKPLCGSFDDSRLQKMNDSAIIKFEGENLGYALLSSPRSKKPVFISPGNKISMRSAMRLAKLFTGQRMLTPIRNAHEKAAEFKNKHTLA